MVEFSAAEVEFAVAAQLASASSHGRAHAFRGKRVCFANALSGMIDGERITRVMAESLAAAAGLIICDRVSRDLDLLARDYGTRVLAEMELWRGLGVSLS